VTSFIKKAYLDFHKAGYAHSIECWYKSELVGGLYGVYVAGVFSGESMFYKRSNASKFCLLKAIDLLKKNGLEWMDIQMITEVTQKMGGRYIAKKEFLERLALRKEKMKIAPIYLNWNI